jgi:hypothetical protein
MEKLETPPQIPPVLRKHLDCIDKIIQLTTGVHNAYGSAPTRLPALQADREVEAQGRAAPRQGTLAQGPHR